MSAADGLGLRNARLLLYNIELSHLKKEGALVHNLSTNHAGSTFLSKYRICQSTATNSKEEARHCVHPSSVIRRRVDTKIAHTLAGVGDHD